MSRRPIPIRSLATRLPDAGRVRIGIKVPGKKRDGTPTSRPEKIDRFRFTSQDRTALDQVAAIYGGQVTVWKEPKAAPGQWQVITEARELRIALPPDPLGNTPIYELWSGGGCQRRCDGETCEMLTQGPDGLDLQQGPCICDRKQELECSLHTRLSVLLPEVRFGGVWRLDTKSSNAAQELPGMVDLIRSLQDKGIVRATMRVEWRKQVIAGKTREFAVPVLGVDASLNELAVGQARVGALTQANQAVGELSAGATEAPPNRAPSPSSDGDVIDAELVEDIQDVPDGYVLVNEAKASVLAAVDGDKALAREAWEAANLVEAAWSGVGRIVTWDAANAAMDEVDRIMEALDEGATQAEAEDIAGEVAAQDRTRTYAPDDPERPFDPAENEKPWPDPDSGVEF